MRVGSGPHHPSPWLMLILVSWVGFNIRTVINSLGPLLAPMQAGLGMTSAGAGLIYATPLALTGVLGLLAGRLTDRWGAARIVSVGVTLLTGGAVLRVWSWNFGSMLVLTVVMGVGIGLVTSALPAIVRDLFPQRTGTGTGVYTGMMLLGSAVAAFLSGTLLRWLPWGWRGVLLFWGLGTVAAFVPWLGLALRRRSMPHRVADDPTQGRPQPTSPLAPLAPLDRETVTLATGMGLVLGLAAIVYFSLASWLPTYFMSFGWSLERAGWAAAGTSLSQVPATFLAPYLSTVVPRRPMFLLGTALMTVALAGLIWAPMTLPYGWPLVFGLGLGSVFGLGMDVPARIAPPGQVGRVAGLVITLLYCLSLIGPYAVGLLRDRSGTIQVGLEALLVVQVAVTLLTAVLPLQRRCAPAPSPTPAAS